MSPPAIPASPIAVGEHNAKKLVDAHDWAQAALASAKEQERQVNQHRDAAPSYKAGDKVWHNLRHWKTDRPSKKLDARPSACIPSKLLWVPMPVGLIRRLVSILFFTLGY